MFGIIRARLGDEIEGHVHPFCSGLKTPVFMKSMEVSRWAVFCYAAPRYVSFNRLGIDPMAALLFMLCLVSTDIPALIPMPREVSFTGEWVTFDRNEDDGELLVEIVTTIGAIENPLDSNLLAMSRQ